MKRRTFIAVIAVVALVLAAGGVSLLLVDATRHAQSSGEEPRASAMHERVTVNGHGWHIGLSIASSAADGALNAAQPLAFDVVTHWTSASTAHHSSGTWQLERFEQEGKSGSWVAAGAAHTLPQGGDVRTDATRVTVSARDHVGLQAYRVRLTTGNSQALSTPRLTLRSAYCPVVKRALYTAGVRAWFSKPAPRSDGLTPIAQGTVDSICGASAGAHIRIVMWLINNADGSERQHQEDVQHILAALDYVQAFRDVNVSLIYDDGVAAMKPKNPNTLAYLKRMGNVDLAKCFGSCGSTENIRGQEIDHEKLLTIDKTVFVAPKFPNGGAPLVLVPSDNWSARQFHVYRQDMVGVAGNVKLTTGTNQRIDFMVRCANHENGKSCPSPYGPVEGDRILQLVNSRYVVDSGIDPEYAAGDGAAITFSPLPQNAANDASTDPLIRRLNSYRCTTAHHTIRLSMFQLQGSFVSILGGTVRTLQARGCDVKIQLSSSVAGTYGSTMDVKHAFSASTLRCVKDSHHKYFYIDAMYDGKPETTLMTGSRNLLDAAAWTNDEEMLRLTAKHGQHGVVPAAIRNVAKQYLNDWNTTPTTPCTFI